MPNNFTAAQRTAIASGAAIKQRFIMRVPNNAAHSSYTDVVMDEGLFRAGSDHTLRRITKAGTRKHVVWNPHPVDKTKPKAVTWSIEADNGDKYFIPGDADGVFTVGGYNADPQECYLIHEVWVQEAGGVWTEFTHLHFVGRVKSVRFLPTANQVVNSVVPAKVVINVEQAGAWEVLRREFTAADGDTAAVTGSLGHLSINYS